MLFDKGDKILFIGDSITDYGRARPVGNGRPDAWGTSYMADIAAQLSCMTPDMGLSYVNVGIGGNKVRDLKERWQTDVIDLKPDWVSVLIGINDVWRQFDCPAMPDYAVTPEQYEENVEKMVVSAKSFAKGVILMTPYMIEPLKEDKMRARMDVYGDICRKLAEKHDAIFVDLQAMFDRYFEHRHSAFIAWDQIHPNQIGATLIAREFLRACGFDYLR